MMLDRYQLKSGSNLTIFEFVSQGPKGQIPKLVQLFKTNYKDVFNLAFGDKNAETGQIDDIAISNNGDSEKVLATVVATVYAFTDKYPQALVYATGSTKARTRLYRMGISKYFEEAKKHFLIYGQINGEWEPFEIGIDYEAFLVRRKFLKFDI